MIFHSTPLIGAHLIEPEKRGDARGFFARMFCEREFAAAGLESHFVQINNSVSAKAGTIRGMHYQLPPDAEVKFMRCVRGALFDVVIDLRPDSPTFKQWFGHEISAENRLMMYVPRGFAHGFMALSAEAEVIYMVSALYAPQGERGLRWNDPNIGIVWPTIEPEVSAKDAGWPDLDATFHALDQMRGLL